MKAVIVLVSTMLVSVAVAQHPEAPIGKGTIYGKVIDHDGQPAKGIGLTAHPLGVSLGAVLPFTRTDQDGKFRFASVPWWGRYTVYAEDEDAGYSSHATGTNTMKEVTISPEQPEAEFNLVLPPKAGFLEIHLMNRKTGEAIEAVQVTVMSAGDKQLVFSQSCSSTRVILIPPDKDLLLHVTSWGFREWAKSVGDGMPIRIDSGRHLGLDVELDPAD